MRTLLRSAWVHALTTGAVWVLVSACAARRPAPAALPAVPHVTGPVKIRVVYPPADALVQSRDSNFIFGSLGTGDATLSINGAPVRVLPNGSFLAWLPVPPSDSPSYELVAVAGTDTARLSHAVRLALVGPVLADTGRLVVDSASVAPRGDMALRDDEPVRVSVRAPANASVWVAVRAPVPPSGVGRPPRAPPVVAQTSRSAPPSPLPPRPPEGAASSPGRLRPTERKTGAPAAGSAWDSARVASAAPDTLVRYPLVSAAGLAGGSSGSDSSPASRFLGDGRNWATSLPASALRGGGTLFVARGADTVRFGLPIVARADTGVAAWTVLGVDSGGAVSDTDRTVVARPTPGGTYKWFLLPGTVVPITGRVGEALRVRLDRSLEVWLSGADARGAALPAGYDPPTRVAGSARVTPAVGWVDVTIPMAARPPFLVEEQGNTLVVTLYGTRANSDIIQFVANDSLVRNVTWAQETSDRARYTVHLSRAPYGYLPLWNGSAFVLRVRRPPAVQPSAPLRGRTIAVDPGHPPIGATGPTGLYEPVPTLAIGERLRALLEERGAKVVMTRTTPAPVALVDRPIIARRANADALVSIHLNALPDGINPYVAQGTGTYFFHPQAEPLARAVQRGMVRHMGLRDLGVYYDNLALARPTWMPSILCEGAFIMIPEQEAALRTPEFREAYARGVLEGLESYFAGLGARR